MEFLLKAVEAELVDTTPDIIEFVKKEIALLIDRIQEKLDDEESDD